MKNISRLLLLSASLFYTQCAEIIVFPTAHQEPALISKSEIDKVILNHLQASDDFTWKNASDEIVWNALIHNGSY